MKSNAHFSVNAPLSICVGLSNLWNKTRPHPGGFDSSRVPTPGNLPSKAKKMPMPGGQPGGEGGGGLGADGIDWCISISLVIKTEGSYNEFINSWHSWHPEGNKIKERARINQKNEFTEKIKVKGSCNSDKNSTFISFQHKSLQTPFLEVNHEITNIKSS